MMQVFLRGMRRGTPKIPNRNLEIRLIHSRLNSNHRLPIHLNNNLSFSSLLFEKPKLIIPQNLFSTSKSFLKSGEAEFFATKKVDEKSSPDLFDILEENGISSTFAPCCVDYQSAIIKEHTMCTKFHFFQNRISQETSLVHVASSLPGLLKKEESEGEKLYSITVLTELLREAKGNGKLAQLLETEDSSGRGIIQYACSEGASEAVHLLLKYGWSATARDTSGISPIVSALNNQDETEQHDIMALLVEKGANVKELVIDDDGIERHFIHLAALSEVSPEAMKIILQRGVDVNQKDSEGMTAMHYAAGHSSPLALALIDYGADVNAVDNFGRTPLHYAIDTSYLHNVIQNMEDEEKESKALMSEQNEKVRKMRAHIKKTEAMERIQKTGEVKEEEEEEEEEEEGEGDSNEKRHYEIYHDGLTNKTNFARQLITIDKVDFLVKDKDGITPLHLAVEEGNETIIKTILNIGGAEPFSVRNNEGMTPLMIAVANQHLEILDSMLQYKVSVESYEDDKKNIHNPLATALKADWPEGALRLIRAGADVNLPVYSSRYNTLDYPLHLAIQIRSALLVEALLNAGAESDVKNGNGWKPIDMAIEMNEIGCREVLRKKAKSTSVLDDVSVTEDRMEREIERDNKRRENLLKQFKKTNPTKEEYDAKVKELDEEAEAFGSAYEYYGIENPSDETLHQLAEDTVGDETESLVGRKPSYPKKE